MKKAFYFFVLIFTIFIIFSFARFLSDELSCENYVLKDNSSAPSKEALERFSGGLKIKTISNPEYEKTDFAEFDKFIDYIQKSYPLIFENCDFKLVNNYGIVLKLKGKNQDKLPNILTAHYDVVGVKSEDNWKYPPFSGYFDKEYIYSRGTIDDKGSVFAILEALNILLKENFVPQSDLYIAFSQTEETASIEGAPKIIEYFKENNIKFNSALDEGGRIIDKNSKFYAFVGTAEKGRLLTKITVYGKPSHASSPDKNTAVVKLAKLIKEFGKNNKTAVISKDIEEYYKTTYQSYGILTRYLISNMDILKPVFIAKISNNSEDRARVATTFAVTIIEASNIQNAVSPDASLLLDSRILPEETISDIKDYINKKIKKVLGDETVKVEYLKEIEPSASKDKSSLEFEKLGETIRKIYPDIVISPYLTLGATDAREYSEISNNTYRFLPCVLKPEESALMHSDNEKISVKNWGRMIAFYREYMLSK